MGTSGFRESAREIPVDPTLPGTLRLFDLGGSPNGPQLLENFRSAFFLLFFFYLYYIPEVDARFGCRYWEVDQISLIFIPRVPE